MDSDTFATFDCDHNNYGVRIRDQPDGVSFDRIEPRPIDRNLGAASKAIVLVIEGKQPGQRFLTMQEWREFAGVDRHSIFADPLYASTLNRDFRLEPDSPNIGAGTDGGTIGALSATP